MHFWLFALTLAYCHNYWVTPHSNYRHSLSLLIRFFARHNVFGSRNSIIGRNVVKFIVGRGFILIAEYEICVFNCIFNVFCLKLKKEYC